MLRCTKCGNEYSEDEVHYTCECGAVLEVVRKYGKPKHHGTGLLKFKEVLPIKRKLVTLDEGDTPFYKAQNVGEDLGLTHLRLKFEGTNPTGSFKDRGTCVAVTKALEYGFKKTCVASTGNMAASVSAYSAEADLECDVFVPADTPAGKLAQVIAYNANLVKVKGSFSDCVKRAMEETKKGAYLTMTGLNPYYIEGEKTISYELQKFKPDTVVVPCGTGGLITAIWKGFKEIKQKPRLIAVQATGCSPILDALDAGHENVKGIKHAKTIASAILIKTPFNGHTAIRAIKESKGLGVRVADSHIVKAIKMLGEEGVFAEPAAALPLAALEQLIKKEQVSRDEKIVLMITGHGLKQPGVVVKAE